jgi:hypothetical protein
MLDENLRIDQGTLLGRSRSETPPPAWWPNGLGHPAAVGGQNDLRYAIFPETRRLVINDRGKVST